jgi:hypothetical protein
MAAMLVRFDLDLQLATLERDMRQGYTPWSGPVRFSRVACIRECRRDSNLKGERQFLGEYSGRDDLRQAKFSLIQSQENYARRKNKGSRSS